MGLGQHFADQAKLMFLGQFKCAEHECECLQVKSPQ